jgi:aquaporin Z
VNLATLPILKLPDFKRKKKKDQYSEPWQRELFSHAPEYAAEFAGTAFLMFAVIGAVAWMFAPGSPLVHWIPSTPLRLFLTGLVLGGTGSLVAISPLGRISGAHLNPAMSLGFFVTGTMQFHDLIGYIAAQLAGASLGARIAQAVFGTYGKMVHEALNQPAKAATTLLSVGAEAAATFVLAAVVFAMVSRRSLMRWTPLALVGVVGVIVWLDGNFSGASLNPARSFGPVVVTQDWHQYWIYILGPCSGSVLAALLHRFATPLEALTGKLFHDVHYRSIFKGKADHDANDSSRRHTAKAPESRPSIFDRESRPLMNNE